MYPGREVRAPRRPENAYQKEKCQSIRGRGRGPVKRDLKKGEGKT